MSPSTVARASERADGTVARPVLSVVEPAGSPGGLDWVAFRARQFPGRRPRHDFQAVVAYGAYKRG